MVWFAYPIDYYFSVNCKNENWLTYVVTTYNNWLFVVHRHACASNNEKCLLMRVWFVIFLGDFSAFSFDLYSFYHGVVFKRWGVLIELHRCFFLVVYTD